jgi:hypothetical protein
MSAQVVEAQVPVVGHGRLEALPGQDHPEVAQAVFFHGVALDPGLFQNAT